MNPLAIAQLLFGAIAGAQSILPDVETALTTHWGQDHVAQAQTGLALLTDAVNRVAAAFAADPSKAAASPEMGQAPAPPPPAASP